MPATNELLQEGRYRISQRTNGSGNVFEAYDTVRNTNVIVREIPVKLNRVTTVSQRESLKLAFANQAKALTEIDHDTLLHVQDFFSEIDRQFLVMEAVDGVDLRDRLISNKDPFSVSEVTMWADELLDALNYLHSRKPPIIHLDIRPENLKLDASGKVKLLGFSLEASSDSEGTMGGQSDESALRYSPLEKIWPGLDAASQKVITNSYDDRSERILKEAADARTDIYFLGATLYFLITGVEPVDPLERSIEVLEGKLDPLREPSQVNPLVPAEISDVIMKALEIKRENRYDSAVIMRQVLKTSIAKVEDRVREETEKQHGAAEIVRMAEQEKIDSDAAEKQRAVEAEQLRQDELLQNQLREAEAQRNAAEHRAAEEERLQSQEKAEHAAIAAATPLTPDDDLLEIPIAAAAEVVAYRDSTVGDVELAAVLEELEAPETAAIGSQQTANAHIPAANTDKLDLEGVQVFDALLDGQSPAHNESSSEGTDPDDEIFSSTATSGFRLPVPAIAGAVGLVVVIAAAAWFMMSGASGSNPPVPAQAVQASLPAQPEASPAANTMVATEGVFEPASSANTTDTELQTTAAPKAAPTAKPKKTETAKTAPDKKKAVTADDLINDN
ncbi:MAG: protein kinase [Blastocatellia bacterium]|nr:protein kinase [Blastocatellia bacterium]